MLFLCGLIFSVFLTMKTLVLPGILLPVELIFKAFLRVSFLLQGGIR